MLPTRFSGTFSNIPINLRPGHWPKTIKPNDFESMIHGLTKDHKVEATIDYYQREQQIVSSYGTAFNYPVPPGYEDANRVATVTFTSPDGVGVDTVDQAFADQMKKLDYRYGRWSHGIGNSPDFRLSHKSD